MFTQKAFDIFNQAISIYHIKDDVNQDTASPYDKGSIEDLLFTKNWIDTVQWHYEDLIRDPDIQPNAALALKRQIDSSNQNRTDLVEYLDAYFLELYKSVEVDKNASINTESPAWAFDRLSILALKIYHMQEEASREDASEKHLSACKQKLNVLLEQKKDLSTAIEQLLTDISEGKKYMKAYKQMKMYNDDELNPVLRAKRS
ncbi:MAG: hypothetical protein CMC18_03815 [Flavobacteriaceae bacterium]|nr:hypothetical protein [Flavobacteriaceae bacterium]